jgi:shikimate dehydrogenase
VRFAVIGDPVAHSKSPAMHMAAYKALGMRHTYEAIPVTKADLPRLVEAVRTGFYRGLNVTVPHKAAVLALADEVSEEAREIVRTSGVAPPQSSSDLEALHAPHAPRSGSSASPT